MLIVGFAVTSLDGCLTRHDEPGTSFASLEDHRLFRAALQTFDSVLAGRKTYEASRASPLWTRSDSRFRVILTSSPERFAGDTRPGELEFHDASVEDTVADLKRRGRERCALLGGARLFTDAVRANLLDELWVTIEPLAFGEGARMFEGRVDFHFALASTEPLSANTLLLKYRRA
jgi:dihydrofolate reductase